MSRGPGTVQRRVLAILEAGGLLDSITVAGLVYGQQTVTPAQAVSVRRALRLLATAGRIADLGRGWRSGRRMWATPERAAAYKERVQRVFGPMT